MVVAGGAVGVSMLCESLVNIVISACIENFKTDWQMKKNEKAKEVNSPLLTLMKNIIKLSKLSHGNKNQSQFSDTHCHPIAILGVSRRAHTCSLQFCRPICGTADCMCHACRHSLHC